MNHTIREKTKLLGRVRRIRGQVEALERVAELRCRAAAGEKKVQLAREFGISRETLYQYLKTDD